MKIEPTKNIQHSIAAPTTLFNNIKYFHSVSPFEKSWFALWMESQPVMFADEAIKQNLLSSSHITPITARVVEINDSKCDERWYRYRYT
jgi:hypothetical protein